MGKRCAVKGCLNTYQKSRKDRVTFHAFPLKHPELLTQWIQQIRREDFKPTPYSFLCSDHFCEDDFEYRPFTGMRMVKKGAIPSKFIFTNGSSQKKDMCDEVERSTQDGECQGDDCVDQKIKPRLQVSGVEWAQHLSVCYRGLVSPESVVSEPEPTGDTIPFKETERQQDDVKSSNSHDPVAEDTQYTFEETQTQASSTSGLHVQSVSIPIKSEPCDGHTCLEKRTKLNQDLCHALLTLMKLKEKIKVLQIMAERTERDLSISEGKVGRTDLNNSTHRLVRYILDNMEVNDSSEKETGPVPVLLKEASSEGKSRHPYTSSLLSHNTQTSHSQTSLTQKSHTKKSSGATEDEMLNKSTTDLITPSPMSSTDRTIISGPPKILSTSLTKPLSKDKPMFLFGPLNIDSSGVCKVDSKARIIPLGQCGPNGDSSGMNHASLPSNPSQKSDWNFIGTKSSSEKGRKRDNGKTPCSADRDCIMLPSQSMKNTDLDLIRLRLKLEAAKKCKPVAKQKKERLKNLMCEFCGKLFGTITTFRIHMSNRHIGGGRHFECEKCGFRCHTQGHLNVHIKNHTDKRPFQCSICSKAFKIERTLEKHQKTHSDLRPFTCVHCGKHFKHKGSLKLHQRQFHSALNLNS